MSIDTSHIDLLNLIQIDTRLKRRASTRGGEWQGACPFCGGRDRFRVQPRHNGGRWYCRQCSPQGGDAITYVMQRDACDFVTACATLGITLDNPLRGPRPPRRQPASHHQQPETPAPQTVAERQYAALTGITYETATYDKPILNSWQRGAFDFWQTCEERLHSPQGRRVLAYLQEKRYLTEDTILGACLGYNPTEYRATWGETKVWLPPGITIPHVIDGLTHTIRVRVAAPTKWRGRKYHQPKGAASALYCGQYIRPGAYAVMVEGEFDALLINQTAIAAGLPLRAVATASVTGARLGDWIARLAMARHVFIAFDVDSNPATIASVEGAAQWWQEQIGRKASRLYPTRHDIGDMAAAGESISNWLKNAIGTGSAA